MITEPPFKPKQHAYRAVHGGRRLIYLDPVRDTHGNKFLFGGIVDEKRVVVLPQLEDGTFNINGKVVVAPEAVGLRIA